MEKKQVIAQLLNEGAVQVNDLKVKNVTVTPCENYVRIALTLDKPVKGMVSKDNGITYEEGETNVIFVSLYSVVSTLKDNEDACFAANHFVEHPTSMNVVLSGAKIKILQENVVSGQEYKNPWSSKEDANTTTFDHDTIINHVIEISLSDFGIKMLDRVAEKLLGF